MAESLEVFPGESFPLKSEPFVGCHPLGRSIRRATDHRQTIGLDFNLRLGKLWLGSRLRTVEAAFQLLRGHILEFPALMHGPEFQRPHVVRR